MHELAITKDVLEVALNFARQNGAEKIVHINLRAGMIRDVDELCVQRYFDYISKGTIASGAKISIAKTPVVYVCDSCGAAYEFDLKAAKKPGCLAHPEASVHITSGDEFIIENIGVV